MLTIALGALACGPAATEPSSPRSTSKPKPASTPGAVSAAAKPPASLPPCKPDTRPAKPSPSLAARQKGLDALAKGDVTNALDAFREALATRPTDLAAFTFRSTAEAERNALRQELTKRAEKLKPIQVAAIAPPHKTVARADKLPKIGAITLKRLSEERHDSDQAAFKERNKVADVNQEPNGADPLLFFPDQMGELHMGTVRHHEDHTIAEYGPALLVVGDRVGGIRPVDFLPVVAEGFKAVLKPVVVPAVPDRPMLPPSSSPVSIPPPPMVDPNSINAQVRDAKVVGPLLVAQFAHDGDGLGAKPDGFVVAYDLTTDKVAWISDAAIATSYTMHVSAGYAVVGFSTTTDEDRRVARQAYTKPAGDSKLNVIDLATGKVVATAPLSARADHVFGNANRVFAWGDESVETFEITPSPAAAKVELGQMVKLGDADASIPTGEITRCWFTNAAIALDHRDGPALVEIAKVLPQDASLAKGLEAAGNFFIERASGRAGIDLTEVEPVPVQPLTKAKTRTDGPRKTVQPRRFVPVKESDLYYPTGREVPPKKGETRPEFAMNAYPNGPSHLYPRELGLESIHWASRDGDDVILAYGLRFIAIIKAEKVDRVLDFAPFALGPIEPSSGARPLAYATVLDERLLLVNSPISYDPKTSTAFLSSVDLKTGATVWRTEAGVLARQPVIFEDYIVSVVNRGAGSDLVAFRRHDGSTAFKQPFAEAASDIGWDGRGALYVTLPKEKKFFTFR